MERERGGKTKRQTLQFQFEHRIDSVSRIFVEPWVVLPTLRDVMVWFWMSFLDQALCLAIL